ncbi:MAG: TetR family transcriptional regulator [Flavobacteriaceae bacterium]|nr:TetR family transcriptional regulator [Flavobacteriaceae bacterium]
MNELLKNLRVNVNEKIFLKDPETSQLGKKIVQNSILLIDELGFDNFTFKKLGQRIGSNESSIYRYFENKHKLLLYLTSWYWGWIEYKVVLATNSLDQPERKLLTAIEIVAAPVVQDSAYSHINEALLNKIVINEFSKSYLTKEVDKENKDGYFSIYKRLITRLRNLISEVRPNYRYPASLASTIVEGVMHQHFLKEHFVLITDCNDEITPAEFFCHLASTTLNLSTNEA